MLIGIVEIGDSHIDEAGTTRAQVSCDSSELLRISCDQEEARALRGPDAAGGLGDTGGRTKDKNLFEEEFAVLVIDWVALR